MLLTSFHSRERGQARGRRQQSQPQRFLLYSPRGADLRRPPLPCPLRLPSSALEAAPRDGQGEGVPSEHVLWPPGGPGHGDGGPAGCLWSHCRRYVHTWPAAGRGHPLDRGLPAVRVAGPVPPPTRRGHRAFVPGARPCSVWRVQGAVTPLLLLLLLHEQLLQSRRARVHHGTGPDRLQTLHEDSG